MIAINHLHVTISDHSLHSVVLCLPQHSMHDVLLLTAHRQFTLTLLLLLEVNKSLLQKIIATNSIEPSFLSDCSCFLRSPDCCESPFINSGGILSSSFSIWQEIKRKKKVSSKAPVQSFLTTFQQKLKGSFLF